MNLLEIVRNNKECDALLGAIRVWLGTELTQDLEYNPRFRSLLWAATYLMQQTEFDWIKDNETPISINKRWRKVHNSQNYALSYGIRFSTSKPHYATLGFIHANGNTLFRIRFSNRRFFILEGSSTEHTYEEIIQYGIDRVNRDNKTTHLYASPLVLNQFIDTQKILHNYVLSVR